MSVLLKYGGPLLRVPLVFISWEAGRQDLQKVGDDSHTRVYSLFSEKKPRRLGSFHLGQEDSEATFWDKRGWSGGPHEGKHARACLLIVRPIARPPPLPHAALKFIVGQIVPTCNSHAVPGTQMKARVGPLWSGQTSQPPTSS